jgi:hypothetical protein
MYSIYLKSAVNGLQTKSTTNTANIKRFFEGVVGFPYDRELLLQAYLFLNIKDLFPLCSELLLFEQALVKIIQNLGKCDFIYLTDQNNLFLIETKYINTAETGRTAINPQNPTQKKVFEQVFSWQNKLNKYCHIPTQQIECAIFTTDPTLIERTEAIDVVTQSISIVN